MAKKKRCARRAPPPRLARQNHQRRAACTAIGNNVTIVVRMWRAKNQCQTNFCKASRAHVAIAHCAPSRKNSDFLLTSAAANGSAEKACSARHLHAPVPLRATLGLLAYFKALTIPYAAAPLLARRPFARRRRRDIPLATERRGGYYTANSRGKPAAPYRVRGTRGNVTPNARERREEKEYVALNPAA